MAEYYVYGRNSVRECIRAGSALTLYVRPRMKNDEVVAEAVSRRVNVLEKEDRELDRLAGSGRHQGFVALAKTPELVELRTLIAQGKGKQNPLLVMLDGLEDPANLGAILRTCDAFGVDGVIIKKTNNVPLNGTVAKTSTGAVAYVPVCAVANLSQALSELKDAGYWSVSSDGSAELLYDEVDYHGPIVLVVGSEGFGISRLVLQRSDYVVKIPMVGHVNSLNASVAAGVLISHVFSSRKK